MQKKSDYNLWIAPLATFIVGFLSFLSLSIYFKVFWINSKYDVPLIYNASVMFGDFILLPLLNYRIASLLFNYISVETIRKYRRKLFTWLIVSFALSFLVNVTAHINWVNDQLTDFVGFRQGQFSIIGYWHLCFSILEMTVLFLFPFLWFVAIKENNIQAIKYSHKTWKFVLLFSTLAIVDMLNKYFFVYHDKTLLYAVQVDKFSFATVLLSLALLYTMLFVEKSNNIDSIGPGKITNG
jgi:hypothetical protein